jgi:photosystem II stability/assembly factor-like uncharacterized protein
MNRHLSLKLLLSILTLACGLFLPGGVLSRIQPAALAEGLNGDLQSVDAWSQSGPRIGDIGALAIAPSNPSIIYAGVRTNVGGYAGTVNDGVYKSIDGGSTWARVGLADKIIYSLAVDPGNPSIVYAGVFRFGIYKSTDGGANWTKLSIPNTGSEGGDTVAIVIDPNTPATVYASVVSQGLWKSIDGGASWTSVNSGIAYYTTTGLVIDRTQPNILYSANHGGVSKTTNGGQSWTDSSNGLPTGEALYLTIDPTDTSVLFVITRNGGDSSLYKSIDGGAHWALSNSGLPQGSVLSAAISPASSSVVFAGTSKGLFKSTDGGGNWVSSGLDGLNVMRLAFAPGSQSNIYAGSDGLGIYKSTDGGSTWGQSNAGLPFANVQKVVVDPVNPAIVYAGTNDGIVKSEDYGATWGPTGLTSSFGGIVYGLVIDPKNPSTLYAGIDFNGVYKSTDAGKTWTRVISITTNLFALEIDPSHPENLHLALYPLKYFRSTDAGNTWQAGGATGATAKKFAVDPTNSSIIYAATGLAVAKSTDGGASWKSTSLRGATVDSVSEVVIDPHNTSVIYAGTTDNGAYKSTDGGSSWSTIFTDSTNRKFLSLVIDPRNSAIVYAGTEGGVLKSTDGGATSSAFNTNLPATATPVAALTIDVTGDHLYAGTLQGVFTCQLSAVSTPTPTPTPTQYPVSGRVTDVNGNGISSVTLTVSGAPNGQTLFTQTDAQGNYSFNNSVGGDTLTPSRSGYTFSPSSVKAVSTSGLTPITGTFNFTGGTTLYTFSGQAIDGTGAPLSNVFLDLTGSLQGHALTDANGNFSFDLFAGGSYSVTASKTGYVFNPTKVTFSNLSTNLSRTFVATQHPYNISGQVKDVAGNTLSDVFVTLSRAGSTAGNSELVVARTNSTGNYIFTNVAGEATYTITPSKTGFIFNPQSATFSNPGGNQTVNFLAIAAPVVQLSQSAYIYNEADALGYAAITVTRTGDISGTGAVDYTTRDQSGMTPCQTNGNGIASDRCDYVAVVGTLRFAAGETSKQIQIPLVNDAYVEPDETFIITLRNPQAVSLGTSNSTVTIKSDDTQSASQNPIDNQGFFIKQQYIDFLGRVAEQGGFDFWMNRMNNCPVGDVCDRIDTSKRFFQSDEFQERGFYVYRLYDAVLGRLPLYSEFVPDTARLSGYQTVTEQRQNKDAYLMDFVNKTEFRNLYGAFLSSDGTTAIDAAGFVNALCAKAGITPASKQTLIDNLQNKVKDPAHTLEDFILQPELSNVGTKFYDRGFITMQYFGYLRRDPDTGGFNFWVGQLIGENAPHKQDYRFMVGGFLQSDEYNFRFALISSTP